MNNILTRMDEDMRKLTIQEIDSFTGADINDMPAICKYQKDLVLKRDILLRSLYNDDNGPTKLSEVLEKAKRKTTEIEQVQENYSVFLDKVQDFFKKWDPLKSELEKRYKVIDKFNGTIVYLKSYEEINELSTKLKNTNDEQEAVQIYGEIKTLAVKHKLGHRAVYIKEILHYWHNILKENFSIQYEEVLKTIKWPITSEAENYSPPKDAMIKFNNLTKNLFLIQEPKETGADILDQEPSLPIKLLLQPLKKRFAFHFMGNRETARVDRPEWFLTQTLTWIREHSEFIQKNVQPIADKLQLDVQVENEFNSGLILLASERLHTILGLLLNPSNVGVDRDAAFAHAVDETLGFHNELVTLTGMKSNSVLSVLTKAENLLRWLAVERKYALAKIEESLNSPNWMEPVVDSKGVSSGVWVGPRGVEGPELWVPRAADWFISLLRTVEHRYAMLPQPGHRLQFLELQQELVEEWRIRLTQLMAASLAALDENTFSSDFLHSLPNALPAIVNAAHHTRLVLQQWANSLHYLQLFYYRRQFEEFTHQQHADVSDGKPTENIIKSVEEVEERANTLATREVTRRNSMSVEFDFRPASSPDGVWGESPELLLRIRDNGLDSLVDHVLMEFKAAIKPYKKEPWHSMPLVERLELSITPSLCRPLAGVSARLHALASRLAPTLANILHVNLTHQIDIYIFEDIILANYWNSGGITQLKHDVERYIVPVFTTPHHTNPLPRTVDACTVLDMDYTESKHLDDYITRHSNDKHTKMLQKRNVKILNPMEVQQIFELRKDFSEVMHLAEYEIN